MPPTVTEQVRLEFDSDVGALHVIMRPTDTPCCTFGLLCELRDAAMEISNSQGLWGEDFLPIKFIVLRSEVPGVFNLGGDIEMFSSLWKSHDVERLRDYARLACDCVYLMHTAMDLEDVLTVALVEGAAFGGGFEAALSCDVILASDKARFAFPESMFGTFPGMGALHLLNQKVGPQMARELVLSSEQSTAAGLKALGLVHGFGTLETLHKELAVLEPNRRALASVRQIQDQIQPVSRKALWAATDVWVDCVMGLDAGSIRRMNRLVSAQKTKFAH